MTKTFFLVPDIRYKPETGPIALGNIIADPLNPDHYISCINKDRLSTRYPRIEIDTERNSKISSTYGRKLVGSVWAQFLSTVKLGPSIHNESSSAVELSMAELTYHSFITYPSKDEISCRIAEPEIQRVMKSESVLLGEPVYMISGLMIAKGLSIRTIHSHVKGASLGIHGAAPSPVGEVGLGASIHSSKYTGLEHQRDVVNEVVFAYKLLEIKLKGWRNKNIVLSDFRNKAAFLSHAPDEQYKDEPVNNDDITIQEIDATMVEAIDEDETTTINEVEIDAENILLVSLPNDD